jgi:hypothetical protein
MDDTLVGGMFLNGGSLVLEPVRLESGTTTMVSLAPALFCVSLLVTVGFHQCIQLPFKYFNSGK